MKKIFTSKAVVLSNPICRQTNVCSRNKLIYSLIQWHSQWYVGIHNANSEIWLIICDTSFTKCSFMRFTVSITTITCMDNCWDIYNGTTYTDDTRVGFSCILFCYYKNIDVNRYLPTSSRVYFSYNSRLSITKIELSLNKIIYGFTYVGWRAQELASQTTMDLFP